MVRTADGSQSPNGKAPDPEVTAKAKRRRFTAAYKLKVLREADALGDTGGVGEFLRREGLYSSHLTAWRRARDRGELEGLAPKRRGRKADPDRPILEEKRKLERKVAQLEKRLAQAEAIIEVQKKVSALLALPPSPQGDDGSDS